MVKAKVLELLDLTIFLFYERLVMSTIEIFYQTAWRCIVVVSIPFTHPPPLPGFYAINLMTFVYFQDEQSQHSGKTSLL